MSADPAGLGGLIDGVARRNPGSPAFFWGDERVSYDALAEASRRVASGLGGLGIGAGDRVALWLPNAPAWLALLLGCARIGAIAVAVNTRFRSAEIADIVGRSGARALALWPGFRRIDFAGILAGIDRAALDRLETVILCGEGDAGPLRDRCVVRYDDLAAAPPLAEDRGGAEHGAVVFTTSGTTKAPKFVLHRQRSLADHAHDVARGFGYDAPGTVTLQALPLCGTFGLAQALATLAAGAPMALLPIFETEEAVAAMRRHRVTALNATDVMAARLIEAAGEEALRRIRFCGYPTFDPVLGDLVAAGDRAGLRLVGLYGASEVQALFSRQRAESAPELRRRAGGFPVSPAAHVRVRDPESGRLLGVGESGELEMTGPSRMAEYLGDPEATRAAITADGYVRIGDLGHLADDGSFVFETRMGDALRLSGFLVAPGEIEARLQAHPTVASCQVVGVSTPKGTRPVAFVTLRAGAALDEAALQSFCAAGLARFKTPEAIVALDAFPTTLSPNGVKIQKAKLREMAAQRLAGKELSRDWAPRFCLYMPQFGDGDFEWDAAKSDHNLEKHGIDFAAARQIFRGRMLRRRDVNKRHETVYQAIWEAVGVVFVVAYTMRGSKCRIISVRQALPEEEDIIMAGKGKDRTDYAVLRRRPRELIDCSDIPPTSKKDWAEAEEIIPVPKRALTAAKVLHPRRRASRP